MKKHATLSWGAIILAAGFVLAASSTFLDAQSTNSIVSVGTNSASTLTNNTVEPANTTGVILTNPLARPGNDAPIGSAANLLSRFSTNGFAGTGTNAAPVIPANIPGRPLYSAFKLINDRNIFDPNRRPGMTNGNPDRPRQVEVESFSLTGIISSDKGKYAFFDGSGSSYRKALKENGMIGGYTITYIEPPDRVELDAAGKKIELTIGTGMRRRDAGAWEKVDALPSYSSPDPAPRAGSDMMGSRRGSSNSEMPAILGTGGNTSSSGGAGDALRRLMLKREQELKNEKP